MTEPAFPSCLMSRKQLVDFLRGYGFPISISFLNKACRPGVNKGPPSLGQFGTKYLYDPQEALKWARQRLAGKN